MQASETLGRRRRVSWRRRGGAEKAPAWFGVAGLCLALVAAAPVAQERQLIEFEIDDQFKVKHTDAEFRDSLVVLVGGGRKGSKFTGAWGAAVGDAVADEVARGEVVFLPYADTRGVPFFLKGTVRGRFPKDPESWTLIDWKGRLAKAYEMDPDVATLLLFAHDGRLVTRVSGTEVEPAKLDAFLAVLRDALDSRR